MMGWGVKAVLRIAYSNKKIPNTSNGYFAGISGGTILYVVVFEILQREKSKSVSGLLQLTFLILGFAVMVCIEVFGK